MKDKRMEWAFQKLEQANLMGLKGSVTIHFSEGIPMSGVIQLNDKPPLDVSLENK